MRMKTAFCLIAALVLCGCADTEMPTAKQALERPFGTGDPFTKGTTKAEVLDAWGQPAHINFLGVDELGNTREEWLYKGWISGIPIDQEYLSRNKHLFFEGDNMVRCVTDPKDSPND